MLEMARDIQRSHKFWLMHIGLFTGARVNEICQINPQTDVQKVNGIWCFQLTDKTAADERIRKSIKTGDARTVPIHPTLLELGIIEYVNKAKESGAKLLFPEWKPRGGKASPNAARWFTRHLKELGQL